MPRKTSKARAASDDELVFLPLGGSGEIGMNMNLYGLGPEGRRQWLMVDCGVSFGDLSTPGVDVIMPDPTFIAEQAENLVGILLTHAHEDHMGAVARLWPMLRAPIYATPFTAWLVRDRLQEAELLDTAPVKEIPLNARLEIGPFDVELIAITHSIPEPNAVVLRTSAGTVLHTGDWKLDPDPMIGKPTDEAAFARLGDEGVRAMVCDSTNVFREEEAGSEGDVRTALIAAVAECEGKVAVAAFASNVARMESAVAAAHENDRKICLVGRSMRRMASAAQAVGILKGVDFIDEDEAGYLPDDKILYLCTGSQGEPRAALSRIAAGAHRNVTLGDGDVVLFSSRMIPGNERSVLDLYNRLVDRGVTVITPSEAPIHVSGHPSRGELRRMYQWARPEVAVAVHGERRHLLAHADLARELQVADAFAPHDGEMIRLGPGPAEVVDEAPTGLLFEDGPLLVEEGHPALRERKKMAFNGMISLTVALDAKGRPVDGPVARAYGLPETPTQTLDAFLDEAAERAERAVKKLPASERGDDDAVEDAMTRAVKRFAFERYDKRPLVEALVLRA